MIQQTPLYVHLQAEVQATSSTVISLPVQKLFDRTSYIYVENVWYKNNKLHSYWKIKTIPCNYIMKEHRIWNRNFEMTPADCNVTSLTLPVHLKNIPQLIW